MSGHYVAVPPLGRMKFIQLADWCLEAGVEPEYHAGGWMDNVYEQVEAHLKFESRQDALAYILAHGGTYQETIPIRTKAT